MPSFPFTPAQLRYTGAEISPEPIRFVFTPGRATYSGGSVPIGPTFEIGLLDSNIRLDRLMRAVPIGGSDGPSMQFQALWQKNAEAVEAAFLSQGSQIEFLTTIVAGLQEAQRAAAEASQGVATLNASVSLAASRTDPVDGLLTANSAGMVAIAAHSRVYSDTVSVAVDAGSVSGFAPGAFVRVFYNDAARAGGAVSYQGTTAEVTQTGDTHVVGGVTIPQAGSPPSEGQGTTPPGYVRPSGFENPLQ